MTRVAETKSEQVKLRLTPSELARVDAMAVAMGKSRQAVLLAAFTFLEHAQAMHDAAEQVAS